MCLYILKLILIITIINKSFYMEKNTFDLNMFDNKKILITGGTGSWANELVKQLLEKYNVSEIRIYSRGEQKQVEMQHKFNNNQLLKFIIGDVRDSERLNTATENIDYVFHMAALKHVPVCEGNPWEAVKTNIQGTQNIIDSSIENHIKKVIFISTDKAVDPLNLYGVTKQCAEKLIIAANKYSEKTKFVCVRGGNVIGSAGSVIPLFREQIKRKNEITLTDENMTRFFLTLKQAISLVFKSIEESLGGEIFVMKMPATKITNLIDVMISEIGDSNTQIRKIGIRPGEKFHEVLVSRYESERTYDGGDYFIILPVINLKGLDEKYSNMQKINFNEFNSENTRQLGNEELKRILKEDGWLDSSIDTGFLKKLDKKTLEFKSDKWL